MSESSNANVLFVSDDPENKYSVKSLLEEIPCDVQLSKSRVRAHKILSIIPFSLIVVDLEIPKTTGIAFCKMIRSDTKYRNIPIIIIGKDNQEGTHCVAALEAGSDDFIEFPCVPRVFLARVNRLLRKKSSVGAKAFLSVQVSSGDLPGILQYLEAEIKTGKLNIKGIENNTAILYFKEGRLVNAKAPFCTGTDAVTEVLCWESSHVTFEDVELTESDLQFDIETTGTVMNCVVNVDEFREMQESMPSNDVMFQPGKRKADTSLEVGQDKIYDLALKGYSTDDLLASQKTNLRKATLWLHQLIEDGYLNVGPPPFKNYSIDAHETYKNSQTFIKRLSDIKTILSRLKFPLPDIPSSLPFGANDWMAPAPKVIITGDNFDNISLLTQAFSNLAIHASKKKPLVRKHLKGITSTRLFFDPKEILDIQQLPPAFDKLISNTINEYITDVYAVIFIVASQDKKTSSENLRILRILRQRFKGIYYFIAPQVPNQNNVSEFRIDCTHCDNKLAVDMVMAGAVGACPICNASLTIPDCLDHLAHSLQLPDEIPIAQLMPNVAAQCRDLLMLVMTSIFDALKPPTVIQSDSTLDLQKGEEAGETDVRGRLHKSSLKILAAVDETVDVIPEYSEEGELSTSLDEEEEYSGMSLDEIINTDEDHFDIDEFIRSVTKGH